MAAPQGAISKRRKFVADGVFYAELNEFFQRELAEEGYSGVEVRVTPTVTDISMCRDFLCPVVRKGPLTTFTIQSFEQPTHKKSLASKVEESVNSPPSSRSDSNSPKTACLSMPLKSKTEVSPPSHNANHSDTNCSTAWQCEGLATVC
jgi:hypothetical protein